MKTFSGDICVVNADPQSQLAEFLAEYHVVFAKHRFNMGHNTELKIELTLEHPFPVYGQGRPFPIHLRNEILTELALLQYLNIITTFPHSKYSSPIFVHRKSPDILRVLFDLRCVNCLLRFDFQNGIFPF